jgi:DNA-binding transcriptional LysR family regulator
MLDKLRGMAVFVRVVEAGSFRRAAERLELSASVVSHHIAQLEHELGVQLLYRSTRHFALTDQGTCFYEACHNMVHAAEDALHSLNGEQVAGRLWVVVPTPFSVGPFLQDVTEFCKLYPDVELRLEFDDGPRNLIQEGIDVAIRIGEQKSSSLVCRRLFFSQPKHYAAPTYLARYGEIATLNDLRAARHVVLIGTQARTLKGPAGQSELLEIQQHICVNSVIALYQLTLAGLGVAELPPLIGFADLAAGRLVEILPDWQCEEMSAYAVFPSRAKLNSLSRKFVDFLHERMTIMQAKCSPPSVNMESDWHDSFLKFSPPPP